MDEAIAWFAFISIIGFFVMSVVGAVERVGGLFKRGPNVEADVDIVMAETVNVNRDPTAPVERYAASHEYIQHRRRGR